MPLSSSDLSDILSRLVETVAEQGEDMQVCGFNFSSMALFYFNFSISPGLCH
jgi:hypothetical protein